MALPLALSFHHRKLSFAMLRLMPRPRLIAMPQLLQQQMALGC